MRRDAGICDDAVYFICVFLIVFLTVCADFNVLFLRQFSSDFCNSRFILKRNVFATEVHCKISLFFQNVFFFYIFRKNEKKKKTGKMYNSDVLFVWKHKWTQCRRNFFFVHALAMFWDQNQKNRSKIDDVIILQNLDTKLKKMSITSKISEISKIPYKQKCLRIRYYTQY